MESGLQLGDVITLAGFILSLFVFWWRMMVHLDGKFTDVSNKISQVSRESENRVETVFKRFDEHKDNVNKKISEAREHTSNRYLKKEVYSVQHDSLVQTMEINFKALRDLLDEKLKGINNGQSKTG